MRIAICTPFHGDVTAEYAYSLAKLVLRTGQTQIMFNDEVVFPSIEIFMRTSSVLPQLRNMLVRDAIDWGANFLLWIDADHKFSDRALLRLLSLNLPVVGANYPRRVAPHRTTASAPDGTPIVTTRAAAEAGAVVPAGKMGLGFCLIDMTVFDRLRTHDGDTMWPLFAVDMVGDGTQIVGEDVYFFRKLHAAGIALHVDQQLSWDIGHVQQRTLTNADVAAPEVAEASAATVRVRFARHD